MKIIYLHQYFRTPQMTGGTRSYEMAKRMVKAGHEVHLLTSNNDSSGSKWTSDNVDGINVHWLPVLYNNKMSYLRRISAFFRFAMRAGSKAISIGGDVVFATSTPLTIAIPAIYAKWRLNVPMVFEVRDLWPELPIAMGALKSPITKYIAKRLELWAYKHSDHVVGLSPGMCEGIISANVSSTAVTNIPNSCDLELFGVPPEVGHNFRKKYNWLLKRPLVIYAGTLGHINGVGYLAEIAAVMKTINPDVRFLVVGDGVEFSHIVDRASRLDVLDNNFFVFSSMKKEEMPGLFSAATISTSLFIPIKEMWANSANKFFDTLAAGKPIAINYGGWQKDIIQEHRNGIILDSFNYELAARKLNELLINETKLADMSEASISLARNEFSRDKLADKLVKLLERLVCKASKGSRSV